MICIMTHLFILHVYTCILTIAGMKVGKQHSKLCQQKRMKVRRFACVFINVALTLIGYRKPPKLDYCFITSTILFMLWFNIAGVRNKTEAASNTASTFLEHAHIINQCLDCKMHMCKIKVGMAVKLRNLASNVQQMNEGSKLRTFIPL